MTSDDLTLIGAGLFLAGMLLEHRLIRTGGRRYFEWGLVCYAAYRIPPRALELMMGDRTPQEAHARARRLIAPLDASLRQPQLRPPDRDPHERWHIRPSGPDTFALRPRGLNPFAMRARLELGAEGGVSLSGFVPWSVMLVIAPGALALAVSPWLVLALVVVVVASVVLFFRALDELIYRRLDDILR